MMCLLIIFVLAAGITVVIEEGSRERMQVHHVHVDEDEKAVEKEARCGLTTF